MILGYFIVLLLSVLLSVPVFSCNHFVSLCVFVYALFFASFFVAASVLRRNKRIIDLDLVSSSAMLSCIFFLRVVVLRHQHLLANKDLHNCIDAISYR